MKNFNVFILLISMITASVFNACEEEDNSVYISLNEKYVALERGLTFQYVASVSGPGSHKISNKVTWSIDKNDFVTIDQNGLVTGLKNMEVEDGLAIITASVNSSEFITSKLRVVDPDPIIDKIRLSDKFFFIPATDTVISVVVFPLDIVDKYEVTWEVEDEEVIVVDSSYFFNDEIKLRIKTPKIGKSDLKLIIGGKEFNTTVYVGATVSLSWDSFREVRKDFKKETLLLGEEMVLKAYSKLVPNDDESEENFQCDWRTENVGGILKNIHRDKDDPTIHYATIVAGDIPSVFNVIASAYHMQEEIVTEITVRDKYVVEQLELSYPTNEINVGQVSLAYFKILPNEAMADWANFISWESSDLSILSVDEKGDIRGIGPGDATVTVNVAGHSASYAIKVNPIVDQVTIKTGSNILMIGDVNTWVAQIEPKISANSFDIIWSSSDEEIATVNSETGKITALAVGHTTITAEAGDKSTTRKLNVIETVSNIDITSNYDCFYSIEKGMIAVYIEANEQNYELIWDMDAMTNGTFAIHDGSIIFKDLRNYALNTLNANLKISGDFDSKRIIIEGEVTRSNGVKMPININVESMDINNL